MSSKRDAERNRFGARFSRTVKLGANFSSIAMSYGLSRLTSDSSEANRFAKDLADALGRTKGPLMKLAQIISSVPDILPPEYTDELKRLQAQAPPMSGSFVRRRMRAELGADWQTQFSEFEPGARHAASLGQVHFARLPDGQSVACKLQYPEMSSAVESDAAQLRNLLGLARRIEASLDPSELVEEVVARLREELDYIREARAMKLYAAMLEPLDYAFTPIPIESLTTNRLLTMSWLEGQSLYDFEDSPLDIRNNIAQMLFWTWWHPLNQYGVIHGDPHLGNYQITGKGEGINLLDFGCIRIFPSYFVEGIIALYRALQNDDMDACAEAYQLWGFEAPSMPMVSALNEWARFIYGPLMDDRVRSIADGVKPADYGRKEVMTVRAKLKALNLDKPIKLPRMFVFLDRAAIGLGAAYLRLDARLNFHRMFEDSIAGFDAETVQNRQDKLLGEVGLTDGE